MTIDRSVSRFKNWLLAGCVVIICYLVWQLRQLEQQSFLTTAKIERLEGEKAIIEKEIAGKKAEVAKLTVQKDIETDSLKRQIKEYKSLPVKEKIKIVKVFKPISTTDSTVCFDEEGIDSINTILLTHKSTLKQLSLSDSIICVQQEIITSDSLLIAKERETSSIWKVEAETSQVKLSKQVKKAKIWRGVAIVTGGIAAVSTLILLR